MARKISKREGARALVLSGGEPVAGKSANHGIFSKKVFLKKRFRKRRAKLFSGDRRQVNFIAGPAAGTRIGKGGAMLGGVGVICFTGSFLLALGLELIRFRFPNRYLHFASIAALAAGLVAQTAYLYHHFILQNERLVVSVGGWFFVLAWGLAIPALYLLLIRPKTPFGLFLLPPALLAILAGGELAGANFPAAATARSIRAFHGGVLLAATLFLLFGFIVGVLYFLQSAKIRRKGKFLTGVTLPSLEWLRKMNRRAVRMAVALLGMGILSGFYINHALSQGDANPIPLSDLMVVGAIFLFLLLVVAWLILTRIDQNRSDRRIAVLTIACFLLLALILLFGVLSPSAHWRLAEPADSIQRSDEGAAP